MIKICNNCKFEKELTEFSKDTRKEGRYKKICKSCFSSKYKKSKEDRKEYYKNNKEKWTKYYIENKNEISEYKKEYRVLNVEKLKLDNKNYYENNKEIRKEKDKEYREINSNKIKQYFSNPEVKKRRNEKRNYRKKIDNLFKLTGNIRNLVYQSFKKNGFTKKSKTQEIIGCSFEELKIYLESKFEPWMNWENKSLYNGEFNYGWDIDHIIPISSAKTEEEIIKLNYYTNLQPLCSKQNRDIKKNFF
jgi:hypothetical protein